MAGPGRFGANWLGITWTLAVEVQFYLCLAVLVRHLAPRHLPFLCLALIAAAPAARSWILFSKALPIEAAWILFICKADALFLGVLAAWAVRQEAFRERVGRNRAWLYGPLGLLALGFPYFLKRGPEIIHAPMIAAGFTWLSCLYAVLIAALAAGKGSALERLFSNRALCGVGIISYSLYLFHQAFNGTAHAWFLGRRPTVAGPAGLAVTAAGFAALLAFAVFAWTVVEKPFIGLGRRLRYRREAFVFFGVQ
jgi:peptidoglycan/LPS O-acetylase OafA/YrhL